MDIGIVGLGYVGLVKCIGLAALGHTVYGFDSDPGKLSLISRGIAPFYEKELPELLAQGLENNRIKIVETLSSLVAHSRIILVCVGTPSSDNGSTDLSQVVQSCSQIGIEISKSQQMKYIVICSTIPPHTTRNKIIPILEKTAGRKHGVGFTVLYHPEFLREGCGVKDFFDPSQIIVGQDDEIASSQELLDIYAALPGSKNITSYEVAETIKYCNNLFHAVKITFANEIGLLCKTVGVDSREVLELFCCDKKLNISGAYLKPGFAFGGSCLPKDISSAIFLAESRDVRIKMLSAILPSNNYQLERIIGIVESLKEKKVGLVGLSFKSGTDDMRESPSLYLVNKLSDLRCDLKIYDENTDVSRLSVSMPSIAVFFHDDLKEVVQNSKILIITQYPKNLSKYISGADCVIIDAVGSDPFLAKRENYIGLYW